MGNAVHGAWDDYWAALAAADRHAALAVVKRLRDQGVTTREVLDGLILPAQARVGELWLDDEWSVAQEHAATAINEGLVHWLGSFVPAPEPGRPLVVVSCLEGERHALPALVVAEGLAEAGYRTTYVGGDPEPSDLLRQVLLLKPRAVLFSASLTSSLGGQKPLLGSIAAIGIPVVVGGRAFGGDERRALALGAAAYADSVDDVLTLLEQLPDRLPVRTPPPATEADTEAAWILEYRHEIAPYVVRAVARRHASGDVRPDWWTEFDDHLDHLLGCLAAALVTGDETIMVEVRDWMEQVLTRRGAPAEVVADTWRELAEPLRGHPLARLHLAGSAGPQAGAGAPGEGAAEGAAEASA